MRIGIVMAMQDEANPVINRFNLKEFDSKNPVKIYKSDDNSVFLSTSGLCKTHGVDNIGTQAASVNTYILLNEIKPDLIINAGTAGGFNSMNGKIGDVYIGSGKIMFHDRRIPLGKFEEYGYGNYPTIKTDTLSKKFGLKEGVLTTGNSLDQTETDMKIMTSNNAACKDMEVAAVAWLCQLFDVNLIALKSITDIVDSENDIAVDFLNNFKVAVQNLEKKLFLIIDYIKNNGFDEIIRD